jgi:hypothetical protein
MNDNLKWFKRHIFGIGEEKENPELYIVIPDAKQSLVRDAEGLALREAAQFRVMAPDGSLVMDGPMEAVSFSLNEIPSIIQCLREELTDLAVKKIRVYSDRAENNNAILMALGCIEIAAGSIGGISVESYQGEIRF